MLIRWLTLVLLSINSLHGLTEDEEAEAIAARNLARMDAAYAIYHPYLKKIREDFKNEMACTLGGYCILEGACVLDKIENISLSFIANRRANIEEARALELLAINKLLAKINSCQPLRPFLKDYPFTANHIQISIGFNGSLGRCKSNLNISDVCNTYDDTTAPPEAQFVYSTYDSYLDQSAQFMEERYDDAVKLNAGVRVQNFLAHQATKQEEVIDALFEDFICLMQKKNIEVSAIGEKINQGKIEEIRANMVLRKPVSQAEARELLLSTVQILLEAVNGTAQLQPFLKAYPFTSEHLKLRISFRNAEYIIFFGGSSIDNVTFENNQITYFQRNELPEDRNFPLDAPFHAKETYAEALDKTSK